MELLDILDWFNYITEALLGAVFALLCFRQAQKNHPAVLFYYLLGGFFACVLMSDAFYILIWAIEDYPFVFSAGDISWVGSYFFLITIALNFTQSWTPTQKEAARKYRWPALAAPAACAAFNAVYIAIYPQIFINYTLYALPTAILLYLSLWLYLAGKKAAIQPALSRYHLTVFIWLALQLICDLFSTLGDIRVYAAIGTVFWIIVMLLMLGIFFSAKKGVSP